MRLLAKNARTGGRPRDESARTRDVRPGDHNSQFCGVVSRRIGRGCCNAEHTKGMREGDAAPAYFAGALAGFRIQGSPQRGCFVASLSLIV